MYIIIVNICRLRVRHIPHQCFNGFSLRSANKLLRFRVHNFFSPIKFIIYINIDAAAIPSYIAVIIITFGIHYALPPTVY